MHLEDCSLDFRNKFVGLEDDISSVEDKKE